MNANVLMLHSKNYYCNEKIRILCIIIEKISVELGLYKKKLISKLLLQMALCSQLFGHYLKKLAAAKVFATSFSYLHPTLQL